MKKNREANLGPRGISKVSVVRIEMITTVVLY